MPTEQQLRWREPWFFSMRMRDRRGWWRKTWLILAVFIAMMFGWYLDQRYGKGLRIGLTGAVFICIGIAIFVGFLPDLGLSEVQATDEGVARAFYGHGVGASLWRYPDILSFSFVPRKGSGKPFSFLILVTRAGSVALGVPDGVAQNDLVELFRRHGIQHAG
jgi:hypothetical protein